MLTSLFSSIGRIIGTGIFSTPSSITEGVGSVGAALMLWVLGLALSFAGLLVWLEFGCMFPRSGGEKVCPVHPGQSCTSKTDHIL